jgi:hypothetical protein
MSYRHYNTNGKVPVILRTLDSLTAIHWISESYAYNDSFRIAYSGGGASFNCYPEVEFDYKHREYLFVGMMKHDLFPCRLQVFEEAKD